MGYSNIELDTHFRYIFNISKEIYNLTNGAFNPSVQTILNYYKTHNEVNNDTINILKQYMDFNMVFIENNKLIKPKDMLLTFDAIAQGYTVDLISKLFDNLNINNYLIEVGGELYAKGKKNNKFWTIGITNPIKKETDKNIITIHLKKDGCIATSGTYQKKIKINNEETEHIIDPINNKPINNKKVSSSIYSTNCTFSDALATTSMIVNESTLDSIILKSNYPNTGYYILKNENDSLKIIQNIWFEELTKK